MSSSQIPGKICRRTARRTFSPRIRRSLETLESRVLLSGNSYTIGVYSFTGGADGAAPYAGLVSDTLGNFYGTTVQGGTAGDGSVYELPAGGGTAVPLFDFTGPANGATPYAGLIIDSDGDLFGTTYAGGTFGDGTIFEIVAGSTTPTTLYSFSGPDGKNPYAGLILDSAGDLFGTTVNGGTHGDGTVFEIFADGIFSTLHSFSGGTADGASPYAALYLDGSGNLFGTTFAGGASGDGTIFEIAASTAYGLLHSFTGTDGAKPTGQLIADTGGDIFGTTSAGGTDGLGTIFGIPLGGDFTPLYSFTGGADGANPFSGLSLDVNGDLFGATYNGGAHGDGTVFEIPADALVPQTLYAFTGATDGAGPYAPIMVHPSGQLFGTATIGGKNGDGVIFQLVPTLTTQMTTTSTINGIQAGKILPPVVVRLNLANSALNVSDTSTVALSIVSGPTGGVIGGSSTAIAINGVATFGNLKFTRAGTYTLAATDGTLDPLVLNQFTVTSGPSARLAFDQQPAGLIAGQTLPSVTVDIDDSLGNVTTDTSTVTLKLTAGPAGAILAGTLTEQAVNGTATFSDLSLTEAGTYTLSASDGHLTLGKSVTFTVSPDTASAQLVFARQPATAIVAKSFSPTLLVEVQDQFGNLITAPAAPVTVTLTGDNATAATLTGTTTVNITKGIATFTTLAISQPGSYQLQVSGAGLDPVTTADPIDNIFIPTHLVFTGQPAGITAGGAIPTFTVSIEDAFNRIDTTNDSLVTISLKGAGTLTGTLSVHAVNGVATFSDLSLDQAGLFSLAASEGTLTLGKSANFNVIPDLSTAHLAVTTPPASPTIVGKPLLPNLVVKVVDQFGNLISSDHSSATLSIVGGPSEGTLSGVTTINDTGGIFTFKNLILPLVGSYSLQVTDATLATTTLAAPVLETIAQGTTSVSGLPATATSTFGKTLTLSAAFKSTAPTTIPFTGVATLTDSHSNVLGTVTLTSAGLAKFSLADIAPGSYLCTVSYPGDLNHTAIASANFTLNVNQAATTTVLTISSSTLVFGQPITLTATVKSTTAIARTGNVEFFDGPNLLQTIPLTGNSAVSIPYTPTTLGAQAFKAVYVGDSNFKTSTSAPATRTVNKDKIAVTLTPSLSSPITHNQTFNLTIHVSILAPGLSTLTGDSVTIKDNGKTLNTVTLDSNGDATLPGLTYTAPGMHSLSAIFAGDADTLTATSPVLKLTIT